MLTHFAIVLVFAFLWINCSAEERLFLDHDLEAPGANGLVIYKLMQDGQGLKFGLKPGDILTHYAGHPLKESTDLISAIDAHAKDAGDLEVLMVRGTAESKLLVKPGKLGLGIIPIAKGKPFMLRPPASKSVFDFALIEKEPLDVWFAFYIDGKHVGFEHNVLTLDKNKEIKYVSEVGFSSAQFGTQHFIATVKVKAEMNSFPTLVSSNFQSLSGFNIESTPLPNGKLKSTVHFIENGKPGTEEELVALPADLMHDYFAHPVCQFMPRTSGTCLRYTQLDGNGVTGVSAMVAAQEEEVEVWGEKRKLFRFDKIVDQQKVTSRWLDEKGVIVRCAYGNNTFSYLTKKEKALQGLPKELVPQAGR